MSFLANPISVSTDQGLADKSLQSCPTLCDPIDSSPPGSPVPGILQARTLEWVAISSPMHEREVAQSCLTPSGPPGLQPTRLLCPWDFPGKSTGVGCHCLLWIKGLQDVNIISFHLPSNPTKRQHKVSLGGSVVKNPPANAGDKGLIPGPGGSHRLQSN